MSKLIDLGVEKDHIDSLTRANGITALSELIWNSLDADSTEIHISYKKTALGGYEYIKIKDNGHGLTYYKAQQVFSKLGGSEKKQITQSPKGRIFHGKEGKGRYKSLALGDLIHFKSIYRENNNNLQFEVKLDRNNLSSTELSDLKQLNKNSTLHPGFEIEIFNVNNKNVDFALKPENQQELEEIFASYWINYPDFKIYFNSKELNFKSLIKNTEEKEFKYKVGELTYSFIIKIIEWNFENKKKTYLCNAKGIPFLETNLGIRSSIPISIFIQSVYIEELHRNNQLNIEGLDEILLVVSKDAKSFARDYIRNRLHFYSKEFIDDLKSKNLYPYREPAENIIEETKRQVFDIVALQVNEYLPTFNEQDDKSKKLTLILLSEALETDAKSLQKILTEVIELPEDKRSELAELLETTSLYNVIDTMTEIKNRLNFLSGLEQIIYDKDLNKNIKERKHLHKIIVNESWIFGDEYTYGVDDISLKNVLKSYLKDCLKREDFEETISSSDNTALEVIPDVCLWHQFSLGKQNKENLIIELKKPSKDAGFEEKSQIEAYASKVSADRRFPKNKTKWKFILITKNIKQELEPHLKQQNRDYGLVSQGENFEVYILTWGDIITTAKERHEFIKEKLKINFQDNQEGLLYIKNKYSEYLPDSLSNKNDSNRNIDTHITNSIKSSIKKKSNKKTA